MLNTQGQNRRSPAFQGPQGTPCCHFEWVPPRCRSSKAQPYAVLIVGMLLVARDDNQVQKSIRTCMHCLQHEGNLSKVPIHLIVSTAPMDLLHVDFTSIEMTMEPKRLPKVADILVFQDHFTKHVMAYMTPNQTMKTIAKFLYQGYILIFGAPARLLRDHGMNSMSSIIGKMCKLLGVKKLQTTPYQPQTNGLVERSHQTIMQMIVKLGEDEKADWPSHLAEKVHAYNATWSTVMGYSPHYFMFGFQPRLPVNFYFSTLRSTEGPR